MKTDYELSPELEARLKRLQETFPVDDVKMTLNMKDGFTFQQAAEEFIGALERLQKYVQNGFSTEGLDFEYASIERF